MLLVPVPALKVVRVEYQPGRVLLSVHAMLFPAVARVLKFCVEGDPRVVRLTHWASAFDPRPSVMKRISRPVAHRRIDFSWLRTTMRDRRNCSTTADCARWRAQLCRNKGCLREGRQLPRGVRHSAAAAGQVATRRWYFIARAPRGKNRVSTRGDKGASDSVMTPCWTLGRANSRMSLRCQHEHCWRLQTLQRGRLRC